MNTLLFMLSNVAIGLVMIWVVRNDRRKGDDTDGVFAIKRAGAVAEPPPPARVPGAAPRRRHP